MVDDQISMPIVTALWNQCMGLTNPPVLRAVGTVPELCTGCSPVQSGTALHSSCSGGMWCYVVWWVVISSLTFWKSLSFCTVTFCASLTAFLCNGVISWASIETTLTCSVAASLVLLNSVSDLKLHCPCDFYRIIGSQFWSCRISSCWNNKSSATVRWLQDLCILLWFVDSEEALR